MSKSRIPKNEYQQILKETIIRKSRMKGFSSCIKTCEMPNAKSNDPAEAYKVKVLIETIRDGGYDIFDIAVAASGCVVTNDSDTHAKNRSFEKFLGGRCDGDSKPDCEWGEIKLSQIVKDHTLEQVMTVGRIYKTDKGVRKIADNFKESSVYNKLKNCSITTYKQKGKQLGSEISKSFVFRVDDPVWFNRIKEDWEFYRNEFLERQKLLAAGKIKKRASGIMKSDTMGKRSPNGTLGIRSDGIIFNKEFFKEVSKYYDE